MIGLSGLVLFRGTDRYSIVILALLLLFSVKYLTILTRTKGTVFKVVFPGALALIGCFDQIPRLTSARAITSIRDQVCADALMMSRLDQALPNAASVFQLPVIEFPEAPPILGVGPYDHFRPYFYSRHLRFSYGSDKGRYRDQWQHDIERFSPGDIASVLEQYGFHGILIDRKGYSDRGAALRAGLLAAGKRILTETPEFMCISLDPSNRPELPADFGIGWYGFEGTLAHNRRWAAGDAQLTIYSESPRAKQARLSFSLDTLRKRRVTIVDSAQNTIYSTELSPGSAATVEALAITLNGGANELHFVTEVPGAPPGNGDSRSLAFSVLDFKIETL